MCIDRTDGFSQIEIGKAYVHLCVYPFRFSLEPCSLCLHHIAQRNYAFLHAEVGVTEVFFCLVHTAQGGLVTLQTLLKFLTALVHLQLNLFLHLFGFKSVHQGFCLGSLHLVRAVAPGEDGDVQRDTYISHTFHLAFKAVEYRWVAGQIASHQGYLGQVFGTCQLDFLIVNLVLKS